MALGVLAASCGGPEPEAGAVEVVSVSEMDFVLGGAELADIRDALSRSDGGLWVLSSYGPHIAGISPEGRVELRFGASGQGPGELRNPLSLANDREGIAVYDVGARRIKRFSVHGDLIGEVPAPASEGVVFGLASETSFAEPQRIRRLGDGWVVETYASGQVSHPGGLWLGRLMRVYEDPSQFEALIQYDSLRNDSIPCGFQLYPKAPLWTVCGDALVTILNPLDNTLIRVKPEGVVERTPIRFPSRSFDEEILSRYVDLRLSYEMQEHNVTAAVDDLEPLRRAMINDLRAHAPEALPPIKMLCDLEDRIWIARFGLESGIRGVGTEWDVFDESEHIAVVSFPDRAIPQLFQGDSVVAIWKDEWDVEHLVRLRNPLARR